MTTFLLPSAIYDRSDIRYGTNRHNLLDRFWEAVHLDSPQSPSDDSIFYYGPIEGFDQPCTPEIFAKTGSTPTIDLKCALASPTAREPDFHGSTQLGPSIFIQPPRTPTPIEPVPEHFKRHFWSRNPSKVSPHRPKLSIPQDLKPRAVGISSPATAILAMASNFLDDIVKLTRNQSPTLTSNPAVIGSPDGDVEVVDSEIHINVIDDEKRAGLHNMLELQDDSSLDKLDIPPLRALSSSETNSNFQSPYTVNGPAESARELDAFSRMN